MSDESPFEPELDFDEPMWSVEFDLPRGIDFNCVVNADTKEEALSKGIDRATKYGIKPETANSVIVARLEVPHDNASETTSEENDEE